MTWMTRRTLVALLALLLIPWMAAGLASRRTVPAPASAQPAPSPPPVPPPGIVQPTPPRSPTPQPSPTVAPPPTPFPSPTVSPRPTAPGPPVPPPAPPRPPGQAPASPSATLIVPGRSVAGIYLGRSVRSVVTRLGPPTDVQTVGATTRYAFDRFGIIVYGADDIIRGVAVTNSLYQTREGAGLGTSEEDVRALYGDATPMTVEGLRGLAYDRLGIAFGIDRVSVAVILIYPAVR